MSKEKRLNDVRLFNLSRLKVILERGWRYNRKQRQKLSDKMIERREEQIKLISEVVETGLNRKERRKSRYRVRN